MNRTPLVDRIAAELNRFRDLVPQGVGDTIWTAGVKNALRVAGKHFNLSCTAKIGRDRLQQALAGIPPEDLPNGYFDPPEYPNEWLHDVSLQHMDQYGWDGRWDHVVIAESEWGNPGDIRDDFQKLLVCRALLRVMIYQEANAVPGHFVQWIRNYMGRQKGDSFLLVAYQEGRNEKLPLLYRYMVVVEGGGVEHWPLDC